MGTPRGVRHHRGGSDADPREQGSGLVPGKKGFPDCTGHLSRGAVVVHESAAYPGVTEEICAPIPEAESGLRCGADFTVGYSPERINPGHEVHTLETIKKIVS